MMFPYPVKSWVGLVRSVPVSAFMVSGILLCTDAVLGDGTALFALVITTFCETHVNKYSNLNRFHPSTNLDMFSRFWILC